MSLHRYHTPQTGGGFYIQRGGTLNRYHVPIVQKGGGLAEQLLKIAGPSIVQAAKDTLNDVQSGKTVEESVKERGQNLVRSLKRKAPSMALTVGSHTAKKKAKTTYKKAARRVKDIFSW